MPSISFVLKNKKTSLKANAPALMLKVLTRVNKIKKEITKE